MSTLNQRGTDQVSDSGQRPLQPYVYPFTHTCINCRLVVRDGGDRPYDHQVTYSNTDGFFFLSQIWYKQFGLEDEAI